jgi:hypothetical protein
MCWSLFADEVCSSSGPLCELFVSGSRGSGGAAAATLGGTRSSTATGEPLLRYTLFSNECLQLQLVWIYFAYVVHSLYLVGVSGGSICQTKHI